MCVCVCVCSCIELTRFEDQSIKHIFKIINKQLGQPKSYAGVNKDFV